MRRESYFRYYRVFKYDTAVTEISTNDFKYLKLKHHTEHSFKGHPVDVLCHIPDYTYRLPPDEEMFYGYATRAIAMRKAKFGAQQYILFMIKQVEAGILKLRQYRTNHHEDLNITLLEANILRLEKEMYIKQ